MPGSLLLECQDCGQSFPSHAFSFGGPEGSVRFSDVSITETCPYCGGDASMFIEEADFEIDEDGRLRQVFTAITESNATASDIANLASLLREARSIGASPEQIADEIRLSIPSLSAVGSALVSARAQGLYTLLALVLAFLAYFYPREPPGEAAPVPAPTVVVQQPSDEQVQRWIAEAIGSNQKTIQDHDRQLVDEAVKKALAAQAKKRR